MRVDDVLKSHGVGGGEKLPYDKNTVIGPIMLKSFVTLKSNYIGNTIYLDTKRLLRVSYAETQLLDWNGNVIKTLGYGIFNPFVYKGKLFSVLTSNTKIIRVFDLNLNVISNYTSSGSVDKILVVNDFIFTGNRDGYGITKYDMSFNQIANNPSITASGNNPYGLIEGNGIIFFTLTPYMYSFTMDLQMSKVD